MDGPGEHTHERVRMRRRPPRAHRAARDPRPWPFRKMPRQRALRVATAVLAVMAIVLVVMLTGISVQYPAAHVELLYTVTSDPRRGARSGVDVVTVPTSDGVQVGLEATIFFHFIGDRDPELLRRFDTGFGTRRFESADGSSLKPWDGDEGFSAFMDSVFRPVLENDLRREIGRFRCEQLVASCTLLRHPARVVDVGEAVDASSNVNIALIEERLTKSLEADLTRTLEAPYFWGVHFRLASVTLPSGVQDVIDDVHAKYASVSGARAEASRARYEDARNRRLAETYQKSPALARIHAIRSAPKGSTIIINDGGDSPGLNLGGG